MIIRSQGRHTDALLSVKLLLTRLNRNAREKIAPPIVPALLCNAHSTRFTSPASSVVRIAPPSASYLLLLYRTDRLDQTMQDWEYDRHATTYLLKRQLQNVVSDE